MKRILVIVGSPKEYLDKLRYISTDFDNKIIDECLHFLVINSIKNVNILYSNDVIFKDYLDIFNKFHFDTNEDLNTLLKFFVPKSDIIFNLSSNIGLTFKENFLSTDILPFYPTYKIFESKPLTEITLHKNIKLLNPKVFYINYEMLYSGEDSVNRDLGINILKESGADRVIISDRGFSGSKTLFYLLRPNETFSKTRSGIKILEQVLKDINY